MDKGLDVMVVTREELVAMWASKTPAEAHRVLSSPDVVVTNQSDKETQLAKIEGLDRTARSAFGARAAVARFEAGISAVELVGSGFEPDILQAAGFSAEDVTSGEAALAVAIISCMQLI